MLNQKTFQKEKDTPKKSKKRQVTRGDRKSQEKRRHDCKNGRRHNCIKLDKMGGFIADCAGLVLCGTVQHSRTDMSVPCKCQVVR